MSDLDPIRVAELETRLALMSVFSRYARAVDTKDEALLASCMATTVRCQGRAAGPLDELFRLRAGYHEGTTTMTGDEFATMITASMRSKGATHHAMTNFELERYDEHNAVASMYLRGMHFAPERATAAPYEVGGYYHHDFVREDGEWKIAVWRLFLTWEYGDSHVMLNTVTPSASKPAQPS